MNAAVRVVSGTKKYNHGLTQLLHSELHWLDMADRVTYKLRVMVYKCLHGQTPDYLSELCTPVAQVPPVAIYSLFHGFHIGVARWLSGRASDLRSRSRRLKIEDAEDWIEDAAAQQP